MMSIQTLMNSRWGVGLALGFGRAAPPGLGYRVAFGLADLISSRKRMLMVQSVRANQWVVSQERLEGSSLDRIVRDTFRHTARCIFTLYHNLNNPDAFRRLIDFDPLLLERLNRREAGQQGLILVGVHLSNFDFVLQAASLFGLSGLAIGTANPGSGYQWQNELRRKAGVDILPASIESLRKAKDHLEQGGMVITGIDRPVHEPKYRPCFFGQPASLPLHHIQLARMSGCPVIVVAAVMQADGIYKIMASEPIWMKANSNREKELLLNAEMVLEHAAHFILQAPYQWSMFYPVWPEALASMPQGQ